MATRMAHSWQDTLTTCGLPLNGVLEFKLQNRGLNALLIDGKQLAIPKQYKRVFAELVEMYILRCQGAHGWTIDREDLANPRREEVKAVTIRFNNGTPVDHKAAFRSMQYFGRMYSQYDDQTENFGVVTEE